MTTPAQRIAKLQPREKPDPVAMLAEIRAAILTAQSHGLQDKLEVAHKVFHCLWQGQNISGTKNTPWPNAIDSRVREAAKIINDTVKLMMRAVRSGSVSIGPEELNDEEIAQLWDKVLKKYLHKAKRPINAALKLFFQTVSAMGYGLLHVDWRNRRRLFPRTITGDEIRQYLYALNATQWLAQGGEDQAETIQEGGIESNQDNAQEAAGQLPPEIEATITEQVAALVAEMFDNPNKEQLIAVLQQIETDLPLSEARIAARELSKKDQALCYVPRDMGGLPIVKAKLPWVNCIHGMDLTGTNCETWVGLPERLSEAGLRERAALNGWKVDLDEMLKHYNKGLVELDSIAGGLAGWDWLLNGTGIGLQTSTDQQVQWYEVITIYRVAVDEAGVPAVYESEIFPPLPELLLSHEVCSVVRDGEPVMPFVTMARNPALLAVQSLGIAQEMLTDQMGMKRIIDSSMAAAELAGYPPTVQWAGTGDTQIAMPGSTLTLNPKQTGSTGSQTRFLEVPGVNQGSLKFLEIMKAEVAERYHRGANADPNLRTAYEEDLGQESVMAYTELIALIWANIQAYVDEVTASRIAGKTVNLRATKENLMGNADINVDFSAVSLNQERAKEFADLGKTLLTLGSRNVDVDALAETAIRAYDVPLAERIIIPGEQGANSALNDERKAIIEMQGGFEVRDRQNLPEARLSAYDQWLANPANIDRCVFDPSLFELVLLRMQGLEMQQEQVTTNVITGQTGQKPPAYQKQQTRSQRLQAMVQQRQMQIQQQQRQQAAA
jgi:hypothetical protein